MARTFPIHLSSSLRFPLEVMDNLPEALASPSYSSLAIQVLVIRVADLMDGQMRRDRLQTMALMAQRTKEAASQRRIWLLLFTRTNQECMIAQMVTSVLTAPHSWCWGVRTVKEGTLQETAQAAIDLHRLHFPAVCESKRATHILVLGSTKEQNLLQSTSCISDRKQYRG